MRGGGEEEKEDMRSVIHGVLYVQSVNKINKQLTQQHTKQQDTKTHTHTNTHTQSAT